MIIYGVGEFLSFGDGWSERCGVRRGLLCSWVFTMIFSLFVHFLILFLSRFWELGVLRMGMVANPGGACLAKMEEGQSFLFATTVLYLWNR